MPADGDCDGDTQLTSEPHLGCGLDVRPAIMEEGNESEAIDQLRGGS